MVAEVPEPDGSRGDHVSPAGLFRSRPEPLTARGGDSSAQIDAIHDLNNLLTVVLGSLEQLHRQPLDERGHRQLSRVEWGVLQAGQLAREVLVSTCGESVCNTVLDLNEAVKAFETMIGQVAAKGVRLAVETTPRLLPAQLDAERLHRALLNLVRNAAAALPGDGSVIIRTAGHLVDGLGGQPTVEISVSDTGAGAAPGERVTTSPEDGAEHRLRMVQRFAAESGGKVEIETDSGQGTTVRLIFPHTREAPRLSPRCGFAPLDDSQLG